MRLMITGARGLIGRALSEHFRDQTVFPLSHGDLDITDAAAVARQVEEIRPDIIFNCAVIGVDDCEVDPALAEAVNVAGPANLATAAQQTGSSMVHFSTNYVFDGERRDFYTTADAARPVNEYGRTKLAGERAVAARCARAFIVRTSWVFGPWKESFLSTAARKLRQGERVKAICDVWASTTYVVDLVERLAAILERGAPATYHLVNDGVCSYEDFAREAARVVGARESLIDVVHESEMMRSPRPRYTPMRCLESERLGLESMRHWTRALAEYAISERGD